VLIITGAIAVIGAIQHRLASLGHEAAHNALFRNKWLNEHVANWLCFYPIFNSVYSYRIQHWRHHQFTNAPDRDPDLPSILNSGLRFRYPMSRKEFWYECVVRPFTRPGIALRFIAGRASLMSRMLDQHAGESSTLSKASRWNKLPFTAVTIGSIACFIVGVRTGSATTILAGAIAAIVAVIAACALLPERAFPWGELKPMYPQRWDVCQKRIYPLLMGATMAWLSVQTGRPVWGMYILLWHIPLITSFAYIMLMRATFQHVGAGEEDWTNTRDFEVPRLIRWAIFPYGQGEHREHHMFPAVPQYRLGEVRKLLQQSRPELYAHSADNQASASDPEGNWADVA
jgi:fatty acid desaturase